MEIRKSSLLIIAVFLILLNLMLVSGEPAYVYKKDYPFNLSITVFNNDNSPVEADTDCYLTVRNPIGNTLVKDSQMEFVESGIFNYNVSQSNTTLLGEYPCTVRCGDGTTYGFTTFSFLITQTGSDVSTAQGIIYFVLLLASIFLMVGLFIWAWQIDGKNKFGFGGDILEVNFNKYIKVFLFLLSYGFLILVMFFLWQISFNFLDIDFMTNMFNIIFLTLLYFLIPAFPCLVIIMFIQWLADTKLHKLQLRGLPIR